MKFFTRLAVLFYVTLILFLASSAILYVMHIIRFQDIVQSLFIVYLDENLRVIVASVAGGFLFVNYLFFRLFSVDVHGEKVIAFDNPAGRVTVSLAALEDLIRRVLARMSEVREARAEIRASKKGLNVKVRMFLSTEVNIPETTSRVQEVAKRKLQDIIGLNEPVNVTVYISKILQERIKEKRPSKPRDADDESETRVPFQGYRA